MSGWVSFGHVISVLDEVKDPCSEAMNRPLGLMEMGLVRGVVIDGTVVSISLCLTEPTCLYSFQIAETIEKALKDQFDLDELEVRVSFVREVADQIWSEERMTAGARTNLTLARRRDQSPLPFVR